MKAMVFQAYQSKTYALFMSHLFHLVLKCTDKDHFMGDISRDPKHVLEGNLQACRKVLIFALELSHNNSRPLARVHLLYAHSFQFLPICVCVVPLCEHHLFNCFLT